MSSFDQAKQTAAEYAAVRPAIGLEGERVSGLVRQAGVVRGRIAEVWDEGGERKAFVVWDGVGEGAWPLWLLRSDEGDRP